VLVVDTAAILLGVTVTEVRTSALMKTDMGMNVDSNGLDDDNSEPSFTVSRIHASTYNVNK